MINVTNSTVYFGKQLVLDAVSCSLQAGRITSFVGPSGSGKTTLLKAMVGLVPLQQGTITIDAETISNITQQQRAEKIGYVFQDFNLFAHMTVLENCVNPQLCHGVIKEQATEKARSMLGQLGMTEYVNQYPHQLSGGQKQRVAIVRALCLSPKVLLLDEPTASLDPVNTEHLLTVLKTLMEQGVTIGLSTQDMQFAQKIFDRVYYLEKGVIKELCEDKSKLLESPLLMKFLG